MKPDMRRAGRAYFLSSVMIVTCVFAQAFIVALGLGRLRVYQFYIAAMALFMLVPAVRSSNGMPQMNLRIESPGAIISVVAIVAAAVAAFMNAHVGNIVYEAAKFLGLNPATAVIPDTTDWVEFAVYAFYAVVMTGVCEEMVMRGIVLQALEYRGSRGAIVISALLFALLHGRAESFIQAFLAGLALGYVFVASDSLIASVVFHMAYNAVTVAMSFLPREWAEALFSGGLGHDAVCVFISAGVLTALMALVRSLGNGSFLVKRKERLDADSIILMTAGIATMACVTLINIAQGVLER